jgi:hypothetical protein
MNPIRAQWGLVKHTFEIQDHSKSMRISTGAARDFMLGLPVVESARLTMRLSITSRTLTAEDNLYLGSLSDLILPLGLFASVVTGHPYSLNRLERVERPAWWQHISGHRSFGVYLLTYS